MSLPATRITTKEGIEITTTEDGTKVRFDTSIDSAVVTDIDEIATNTKGTNTRLDTFTQTKGGQKFLVVRDINELFSETLTQLKIIVAQNNEVHDLNINELDIRRD